MSHTGLGLTWELADPKFDPEFLFHIIFTDNHKDEVVNNSMLQEWMLHFYLMSNLKEINMDNGAIIWAELQHRTFPPIIKLWINAKLLKPSREFVAKNVGYKLLVEPRKIDQEALRKGQYAYDRKWDYCPEQ